MGDRDDDNGEKKKMKKVTENCNECAICLESFHHVNINAANHVHDDDEEEKKKAATRVVRECGHKFHEKCLSEWFKRGRKTCPLCRRPCCTSDGPNNNISNNNNNNNNIGRPSIIYSIDLEIVSSRDSWL